MGRGVTADVLDSPALPLLVRLETEGFEVQAGPDVLRVRPVDRVTPELRTELQQHKADLLMLVRICDTGVLDRQAVFARQIATAPTGVRIPRMWYREVPYRRGSCHSCGASLDRDTYGSCWRCMFARRLACRAPIPADLLAAHDEAPVLT